MSHILILSDPLAASPTKKTRITPHELISCTWRESIGGDRGTCHLVLAADGRSVPSCGIFDVVRIYDDAMARAWEYRIVQLIDGPHLPTVTVHAVDLSHDLGRTRVSQTLGGVEQFALGDLSLTPDEWIDTVVLPSLAAAGITWVIKGTITPTAQQVIGPNQTTCGAIMAALEAATKFEWWLEPNGDTNYKIMLGRRSTAGTPWMFVGQNVKALEREIVIDEKFFNRAIPRGASVGDEPEASGIAQHGWKISAVSGDNVTLAHPQAGGGAPICFDDQLNGLKAGVSLDGVLPPRAMTSGALSVTWDAPRQTVWWIALRTGSLSQYDVCWHSYATGASGRIQVSGSTVLAAMVIDATRAELFVACTDADKVERIDLVTRASVGNIATGTAPTSLTNLRAMGIAELAVGYGGAGPELFNLTTLASVASIDDLNGDDSHHVIYDSGSSRYVTFTPASSNVSIFNSSHAQVGGTLDAGATPLAGAITGGVIHIALSSNEARTLTVSTATLGSLVALPAGVSVDGWIGFVAPLLSGKLYVADGAELFALNTAASYAISGRVAILGSLLAYDATDDVFLSADGNSLTTVLYRNGNVVPSGRLRFNVDDTAVATQQIVKPSATKGPLIVGQQLVEFRKDASDTYSPDLTDPLSLATYGPVDGYPQFPGGYKRNYKLDPRLDAWASDGVETRPRWLGFLFGDTTNVASVGDLKWAKADAPAARATSALVNDGGTWTVNVPDTLAIDGLPAAYVVHAGAILSYSSDTALAVLDRAVADGGGAVTLSVLPLNTKVIVNNDPITVHQPAESDALGDFMLGLPIHDVTDGRWPLIAGAVHLPSISGASQAWIRFRFLCLQFGGNTNAARVNFSGYDTGNVIGPAAAAGTLVAPVWSELVLEKQVALNTVLAGTDHFLGFIQAFAGADAAARKLHLWLKAIEVYVVTAAAMPEPLGAIAGDELVPWIGANYLLCDELRGVPSFHYKVEFIERPATPTLIAQTAQLRDVARGIAATPRIADIEYEFPRDASEIKQPKIVLQNRVPSAMESLAGVGA